MRHFIAVLLVFLSILVSSSCKKNQPSSQDKLLKIPVQENSNAMSEKQEPLPEPPAQPVVTSNNEEKSIYDLFVDKDTKTLSYKGYTVIKASKKVWIKEEGKYIAETIPCSILKKGKKVIKKFEYESS